MKSVAILNVSDFGSTGKIAAGLHEYLKEKGYSSCLCYQKGENHIDRSYLRISSKIDNYIHALLTRLTGKQGCYSILSTWRLIKYLKKMEIDTIFGVSLHGYYLNESMLFEFMAKNNITFVYIMIDDYPFLGKCCYNRGCNNFLTGCGHCPNLKQYPSSFVDSSAFLFRQKNRNYNRLSKAAYVGPLVAVEKARISPLLKEHRLEVIDEAIDVQFYHPYDTTSLRKQLGIPEEKIICVCVGLYNGDDNHTKGVKYFIDLAKLMEGDDRYVFVQVGFIAKDKSFLPSNYIPIGFVNDQEELCKYYSMGDIFVFPTIEDSMPNTCIEALSCGTPLLCFDISGMSYMAPPSIASFVEARNVEAMRAVLLHTKKKTGDLSGRCRGYAIERYDNQKYFAKLENVAISLE